MMHAIGPRLAVAAALTLAVTFSARAQTAPTGGALVHLTNAAGLLKGATETSAPSKAEKKLNDTRNHFALMMMAYNGKGDWTDHFYDVENDLVDLIGGGTHDIGTAGTTAQVPPTTNSGNADTAPLSSVNVKDVGMKGLDPALRGQLEHFRVELELFAASTMIELD